MNYRKESVNSRNRACGCAFSHNTRIENSDGCCTKDTTHPSRNCVRRSACSQRRGSCGSDNGFLQREAPVAMVYSPMQEWKELYDPHTALSNGTIFKELDLPFYPTPCRRKECSQCQYR